MTIGVTGASGKLGHLVLSELTKRIESREVVALARSPEKVAVDNIEVRAFDYEKESMLCPALEGVNTLVLVSSTGPGRVVQHRNVIQAAQAAGVKHIVYTGVLHTDTSTWALAKDHKVAEADLQDAAMPVSVMRHSIYSEIYIPRIAEAVRTGSYIGSVGPGRTASASRADLAEALAIVAIAPAPQGLVIHEMAGDEAWTMEDLAVETSRQIGRAITYRDLSPEAHLAELVGQGIPENRAALSVSLDAAMRQGSVDDDSHELSRILGRPTASLKNLVAQGIQAASQ